MGKGREQELPEAERDAQARERIVNDLDTTFLAEAGAGSGKTALLAGRMLSLVRSGKAQAREIAAITFTNKAAEELSARYRMLLEQGTRECANTDERLRLTAALKQLSDMFIGTIHAFCGRLLRERPIEAGIDPAFAELNERQSIAFRHACWDAYLEHLRETGQEERIGQPAELGIGIDELKAAYDRVIEYEDVEIVRTQRKRPDFDVIRHSLPPLVEEAFRHMPSRAPVPDWDGLQQQVREARKFMRTMPLSDDMHVLRLAKMFDRPTNVIQKRWKDRKQAKELKNQFEAWRINVLLPFLTAWREYVHPHVIEFVLPAAAFCREKKLEAGVADFRDLLMKAAELLRKHPGVRRHYARKVRYVLVDEFQDIDPVQAEMLFLLTGEEERENDWRNLHPRPGSLFIVGDPKQSVYRFRRADISIYNEVKRRTAEKGAVLQLTRNFRSVQAVGRYVNYAFESKFAPQGKVSQVQAPYAPMLTEMPNPKNKRAIHGVYTITIPKVDRDRKISIAGLDSDRIAAWIAWACSENNLMIQLRDHDGQRSVRPARPGDFLIVLERRELIGLYAEKLETYGIHADTSGSAGLHDEVRSLVQLARYLNDPTDRVAQLAVMRGMLFGVSDDALYHYKKHGGSFRIDQLPDPAELPEQAKPCCDVLSTLQKYEGWARKLPGGAALAHIADDLGLAAYAAMQPGGSIRAGTIVKLLELVQTQTETAASWHELTAYLEQLLDGHADGLESTSLSTGTGNAVRIMNVHRAKGLEAPVVFMACPCGGVDHDAREHIDRTSHPPLGYFAISRQRDAYVRELVAQPAGWEELSAREREFMRAEDDRLLYSAATRARQLLVVCRYPSKPAIDPWSALTKTLARQPELEQRTAESAKTGTAEAKLRTSDDESNWLAWKSRARFASYETTNINDHATADVAAPLHRPREGRGMAFGIVVHRALEAIGNGSASVVLNAMESEDIGGIERLERMVRMLAEEEGMSEELVSEACGMIVRVLNSDIWQRGLQAKQKYHEFSFLSETNVRGVMDFLFEEDDGWVILDFKTDMIADEHLSEFAAFYMPQLEAYVRQWNAFGYKVKEAGMYFLDKNRYIPLRMLSAGGQQTEGDGVIIQKINHEKN